MVIPLIDKAVNSIKIVVFDWRWYMNDPGNPCQLFNQSIVRAKNRGVKIKVISNIPDIVVRLNALGIEAKKLLTPNLVHVKMMIIDEEVMIIGSHNYTQNAFTMNYELSVILEDKEKEKTESSSSDVNPCGNLFFSFSITYFSSSGLAEFVRITFTFPSLLISNSTRSPTATISVKYNLYFLSAKSFLNLPRRVQRKDLLESVKT